ncbi:MULTISPECIES: GtrA family protein [Paenibacillus]|uniref:Putative flippase GtrA n=1 Tax=Paenibacillus pabuli TaxID=1472 RepID=A0A855Y558_9BACL|nr:MULTISPECIES: GtrA family protein [Paenibacillus]PWW36765.1 putative flippase GtrA [Paenibacillus pabuli]PXW04128.1 putative flippase GtrA [Paenibacillus taichungensis]
MTNRLVTIFKFGIVGVLNTAVDAMVFTLLAAAGAPALIAQVFSYSCGIVNSYWWNGRWTFQDAGRLGKKNEIMRFVITNLVVLALSSLILYICNSTLGWSVVMSKILATLSGMVINYIASRYWVFRAHSVQGSNPSSDANERSVS